MSLIIQRKMKGLNINKVEFKADHKVELEYYENQNLKTF